MKFRRRPFTLLEVLIASTIFLGLAIVLFVYAGQTTQSWSKLQVRRNQLNELLALDRAIDTVLPNIIPFTWPDPEEETEEKLEDSGNTYKDGVYTGSSSGYGGKVTVQVTVKEHKITDVSADFDDDDTLDWSERLIWVDEWETEESERTDAPLAIIMTVNWKDGRSETWFRRTMGNSYRERFGKWEAPDETTN